MLTGSCLCGDAAWEIDGPLESAIHCHCGICRKHHGSTFTSYAAAPERAFRWLRGRASARRTESSPGFFRHFCGRCGSKLPGDPSEGRVFVALGNLEGDPDVRPMAHIFAGSKAPWHEWTDSLPRFDTWPPGIDAPVRPSPLRPGPADGRAGGSCLCGAVAYAVDGPMTFLRNCHCSRCRKARSAAFATNAPFELGRLQWIRGEKSVQSYKVPEARFFTQAFCGECGSPVPRLDSSRGLAIVPAGSLDHAPGARVHEHIFADSKAPWFEIRDTLTRHAEAAPAR
jgi:hypothetical protein